MEVFREALAPAEIALVGFTFTARRETGTRFVCRIIPPPGMPHGTAQMLATSAIADVCGVAPHVEVVETPDVG